MRASDSANSLTGLTEQVAVAIEEACFICMEDMIDNKEPLVDSSLLRTCGCRFKVHPICWNEWMKGKTDYDCPICRKKSLTVEKSPVPLPPPSEWQEERLPLWRRPVYTLVFLIFVVGASIMVYEIIES